MKSTNICAGTESWKVSCRWFHCVYCRTQNVFDSCPRNYGMKLCILVAYKVYNYPLDMWRTHLKFDAYKFSAVYLWAHEVFSSCHVKYGIYY